MQVIGLGPWVRRTVSCNALHGLFYLAAVLEFRDYATSRSVSRREELKWCPGLSLAISPEDREALVN